MPKTISNIDKNLIKSLRTGIAAIETGGSKNPYSTTAGDKNKDGEPDSTALGKYQFLEKYWWDRKGTGGQIDGFKEFAKGKEDLFGPINKWEDISGNKALQEAYFEYYATNHLIPKAKQALSKGNPLGLTLPQAIAVMHKNGHAGGREIITSGKLSGETDTNVSDAKYLRTFNDAIKGEGLENLTVENYSKNKSKEEGVTLDEVEKKSIKSLDERMASYEKREAKIKSLEMDEAVKNELYEKLYQDVAENGDIDSWNEQVDSYNNELKSKSADMKDLVDLAENMELFYNADNKEKGISRTFSSSGYYDTDNKGRAEIYDRLKKKYPDLFDKQKGSNFKQRVNQKKLFNVIEGNYKKLTGKEVKITPGYTGDGKDGKINSDFIGNTLSSLFGNNYRTGKLDLDNSKYINLKAQERMVIDKEYFKPKQKEWEKPTGEDIEVGEITSEVVEEEENDEKEKKSDGDFTDKIGDYLNTEKGILSSLKKDDKGYDKSNYKKEIPFDALSGMALGLIGNEAAKNAKIPLRTEDVSQAVKAYTAEMKKQSQEGLPPEVEAAIMNNLAEGYQGGLKSITNASGGNRATVLGNLGTLENAKQKGLVDMVLADYQAKQQAFDKYSSAIQYMDKVKRDKEIANTTLKQEMGMRDKISGETLASAGFEKMIDGIKYQKENGPGSMNHMYQSALMQKIFGFDPNMKDDGSGTVAGTKSKWDKEQGLISADMQENKNILNIYNQMPQEQKVALNQKWEQEGGSLASLIKNSGIGTTQPNTALATNVPNNGTPVANNETGVQEKETSNLNGIFTPLGYMPNNILDGSMGKVKENIMNAAPEKAVAPAPGVPNLATAMPQGNMTPSQNEYDPIFGSGLANQIKNI